MSFSRTTAMCCGLIGLAFWLTVACAAPAPAPTSLSPGNSARLYTRTPTPTATPTPTLHPQFLHRQGLTHRDAWNLVSALERFDMALAVAPSAPIYASRAEVYRLMGRLTEAAADIDKALELDPELAEAWRQKALLSSSKEAWNDAWMAVNKLIELEPDDGSAFFLRAQIYSKGYGKLLQALVDYRRAISRDPVFDKATLVERWHILAKLGYWQEALLVSHEMTATGSEDPLRYFYRGWSLIKTGRLDEAIERLIYGIRRYPEYPVALYYALGVAYYERKAWSEAIQMLDVALTQWGTLTSENAVAQQLDISETDILGRMGVAYLELRQCETGAALVERAIAESAHLWDWYWAREHIESCYYALTPTPTSEGTPAP